MGQATRLRATDFVLRQLEHVIGKTNELSLPMTTQQLKKMKGTTSKLSSARALDMETTKWSKRKRGKQYHSKTTRTSSVTVMKSRMDRQPVKHHQDTTPVSVDDTVVPPVVTGDDIQHLKLNRHLHAELNDEDIERHMRLLRDQYPDMHGLQPTVLGSCHKYHTVPLFAPVPLHAKFVQPLNVGDHWITVTNMFSTRSSEIQLYDSCYRTVNDSTVVQCSSLLRLDQQEDFITFSVRNYAQQTRGTRICGYYAVASMIALCAGVDVSAHVFDENILVEELEENVKKRRVAYRNVYSSQ